MKKSHGGEQLKSKSCSAERKNEATRLSDDLEALRTAAKRLARFSRQYEEIIKNGRNSTKTSSKVK